MRNVTSCWRTAALALCVAVAQGSCSGSVNVGETFPVPLVERLPLKVGLVYSPALAGFTYAEEAATDRDWKVQLGGANVRMFDAAFGGMFAVTQRVSAVQAAASEMPGVDAIIAPAVEAFEFSSPSQSATDQFAVWIRYNVDVYKPDGELLVRWPIAAYGQSGTDGMNDQKSMERATVLALRDAAATLALNFARQPKIREALLKAESQDATR